METHIPWTWSEPHKRFYKYDASGNLLWIESSQIEDRGITYPYGPAWTFSVSYQRYYRYEYGDDHTILETLWSYPGPPKETEADMRNSRCTEWLFSAHYYSYYRLMYGDDNIVLKTIWEPTSTKEAERLINSARKAVHFAYRQTNFTTTSYYIPTQCRTSENDKERQRDDRNDRNRHERSGHRDSDPSGGRQHPDNGDQLDDGDETQLSLRSLLSPEGLSALFVSFGGNVAVVQGLDRDLKVVEGGFARIQEI